MTLQVELIYDTDCPNVKEARRVLLHAFTRAHLSPTWKEFDRHGADSQSYARDHGSPTILVNGKDVAESADNRAACCRLYVHGKGVSGVPSVEQIVAALKESIPTAKTEKFRWRQYSPTVSLLDTSAQRNVIGKMLKVPNVDRKSIT